MSQSHEEQGDLTTIGVTEEGSRVIEELKKREWFATGEAAFRSAVTFALANNLEPSSTGSFSTTWNIGTLDRDGAFIRTLQPLLNPNRPWDQIRRLGDAGLRVFGSRLDTANVPSDLFASVSEE